MSTSIHNRVREDTNLALKQREKGRVAALRLILAEMKRVEVDEQQELSDVRALQILDKMTKQRRDSYSQFLEAGRKDLADQEEFEIKVISEYMPTPLTEIEIEQIVLSSLEKLEELVHERHGESYDRHSSLGSGKGGYERYSDLS